MTPESFTYWLQGFVELSESNAVPNEKQWLMIKDHLKLVFDKVTPVRQVNIQDFMKKGDNPVDLIGKYFPNQYIAPTITC